MVPNLYFDIVGSRIYNVNDYFRYLWFAAREAMFELLSLDKWLNFLVGC